MVEFRLVKWHRCLRWHTMQGMPHGSEKRHMYDSDCNDILSYDCSYDEDSSYN